jgi:HEAT repeat protein
MVLAAYRYLTSIVSVMTPESMPEMMSNLAASALHIDPHVVMQLMKAEEDPASETGVVAGMVGAFDDTKVAQLLATALALDGKASERLATIFNTIAPDEDRKRRVLTLTRSQLAETDFGKAGAFKVIWTSMEELLVSYNDKPFLSDVYRTTLDGVGSRAERMSATQLPAELPEWMESLGQANVRRLSVLLLIDLFALERDAARAAETAADLQALAEDLLMSGAYDDALSVVSTLADRAKSGSGLGRDACRIALDRLGESVALRETALLIGEVDENGWTAIRAVLVAIGVVSVDALKPLVMIENDCAQVERAGELIVSFGPPALRRLASLVGDSRWFVQRRAALLLGRIGSADAVPLLQPLLRQDPRVARAAVSALGGIDDPSAARAIHTVLRAATGELRRAVVEALVADRDPRVVPMLVRILGECEPLGRDHEVVLETLSALGIVGGEQAIPTLFTMAQRRGFFGRRKLRAVKERSVDALARIGTPQADVAMHEAAASGDRMLKKIVAARGAAR